MPLSLCHLQSHHEEEYGFLSQITGDETWCHHFEPESKSQNKQWKRAISPPPKKSKVVHTRPLKRAIHGHRFKMDDEVCERFQAWIQQQPTSFLKDGIDPLMSQ
ncbi:mariner Mos1 transposase [Trichonephila clavipes]|nr:mariner Mos1 transposase [Trichonephila clavipes]